MIRKIIKFVDTNIIKSGITNISIKLIESNYQMLYKDKESFEKVIHPVEVNYTAVTLIILVGGILTKYFLGTYVEKQGELLYSESLKEYLLFVKFIEAC